MQRVEIFRDLIGRCGASMAVNRFNKRKEFEARDRFMRAFSTRKLASAAAVAATAAVVEAVEALSGVG